MRLRPAISMGRQAKGARASKKVRVGFAPDEGLHAAHRGAEDEAEMIDVEAFEEHGCCERTMSS